MKRGVFIFWSILTVCALVRVYLSLDQSVPDIGACLRLEAIGTGTVDAEPERKASGQVFVIHADSIKNAAGEPCASDILVRAKTKLYPEYSFGDRVTFSGKISKPFNFKSDTGRSFDYEGYLAKDDIYYEMKSAQVERQEKTSGRQLTASWSTGRLIEELTWALFYLKHSFVAALNRSLGEPHAALAAGLVVGEKAALGSDLLNDFRTVGLIHIVVLSGFNITVVADAMRRLLSFLPRVWGIVIGGIGIALFGILVGGGATVVRSCVMASIALSADLIRRDYNVKNALAFAALIMLIQNPMILLHDPSFQLSFLATLGLVMLATPVEKKLGFIPKKFGMRGVVAATIATQIFVSPYILYMMGQLSIIGTVVNILVLPFIPATMLFVFLTGAIGTPALVIAHQISQIVGWIAHLLLSYELWMVTHFARIPFAAIHLPPFSGWWVAGFYAALAAAFLMLKIKKYEK